MKTRIKVTETKGGFKYYTPQKRDIFGYTEYNLIEVIKLRGVILFLSGLFGFIIFFPIELLISIFYFNWTTIKFGGYRSDKYDEIQDAQFVIDYVLQMEHNKKVNKEQERIIKMNNKVKSTHYIKYP